VIALCLSPISAPALELTMVDPVIHEYSFVERPGKMWRLVV
jgi:hypothetical protein